MAWLSNMAHKLIWAILQTYKFCSYLNTIIFKSYLRPSAHRIDIITFRPQARSLTSQQYTFI